MLPSGRGGGGAGGGGQLRFPIVSIAASAGGLEAVSELLAALPSRSGMAFIVVQHLDPDHESLLTEILAKRTDLAVVQAHDGLAVEPDHVYVIPPNAALRLEGDQLRVTPRASGRAGHMPADLLFRSLADARSASAIGVVLSGGDADGSLGVQAIKDGGGITFAQEPSSARFPSMPRNAIDTGCVDFVLRPKEIAAELIRLGGHSYLRASVAEPEVRDSPEEANAREEASLRRVFRQLRTAHGVDFTHYKRSTLRRRLTRRMALRKFEDLEDYVALIEDDPAESAMLYQDFLIRVTGFFRDPEAFDVLAQSVFPRLLEGRSPKEPIRIWVPGCATGEEVYSIAMTLMEHSDRGSPIAAQIFGTDVSESAVEKARAGVYLDTIAHEVSDERLRRFFTKQGNHYRIAKNIRDLCIFARQDVTRDPPFSRLDFISCRNLLIYLDANAQRRVIQVFHYALRPYGVLMLGPSESVGQSSDLFELTDKHHRLYARIPAPPHQRLDLAEGSSILGRSRETGEAEGSTLVGVDSAQREADRLLLARLAPASLLVDETLNILQFRGETGPYLQPASGPPSLNLNLVARPELMVEIASVIQEVRESGTEARREGLSIGDLRDVSIEVIPFKWMSTEQCYLLLFEDGSRRGAGASGRRAQQLATALPESEKDRRLAQFARENAALRGYLEATREEHEAVKEELRSAHEEVLSANEELQSTNEELETAKEELQSSNEELTTTNDELRNRNRDLTVLNAELEKARTASEDARAYGDAIIETVREPLLVLDSELRILRANQAFYADFGLSPDQTLDRFFYDVDNGVWNIPSLREHLDAVLTRNQVMSNQEIAYASKIGRRVMSLSARTIPGDRPSLLLAIEDITQQRADTDNFLESSRNKDEFLAMLAHELRNPLSPIRHSIHLLQHTDAGASTTKLYGVIERQSQRLERIVHELLDLARISRGIVELKREPVDLVDIARHAAEAIRPHMEERRHELSLVLPNASVRVDGDSLRLEQVVANLLENAAKYTDPGGQIILTITREMGEAVLSVRDTGIGISQGMLKKVFDLFVQGNSSFARKHGGLGLGLSVVQRILELHGGRIEARSAGLGQGSEFKAWLPLLPATHSAPHSGRRATTKTAASPTRTRRILVVDDSADSAESTALLIQSWGHEVAVARDGPQALRIAGSFNPEIALIDIGLPGMDGLELARLLRRDPVHRDLQLVALTGYGRAADVAAAHAAGFDLHLVKPANIAGLRTLLATGELEPSD